MGYQRKTYVIKWPEGHVHHGLIVKLRGLSGGNLLKVSRLRNSEGEDQEEMMAEALQILADRIVSWNLEEGGEPILPTLENIHNEDFGMVMDILNSWTVAATQVAAPLVGESTSGKQFPEESIPMETLSPSLTN